MSQMAAPVASASAGSVSRSSLQPVSSQPLPAPVAQAPALAPAPVQTAQAPALAPAVDRTTTGTVAQPVTADQNTLKLPGKKQLPATLPSDKVAVLPQQPKTKETASAQLGSPTDSNAKPAGAGGGYKVVEGDTLNRIAKKLGVTTAALKEANGLQDGRIRIGQSLKVPNAGSTVAKAAPAVDPVVTATAATAAPKPNAGAAKPAAAAPAVAAYTPPKKDKLVQQAEESAEAAPNATGIDRMRWPVRGRVVANYGKGGGKSNDIFERLAEPAGQVLDVLPGGAARAGAARRRPFQRLWRAALGRDRQPKWPT
jgi:LysM repeat protein